MHSLPIYQSIHDVTISSVINLCRVESGPRFAGVICNKDGEIQYWHVGDPVPDRTVRTNHFLHNIRGMGEGKLIWEDQTLVELDKWYDWDYHPNGVAICHESRINLVVLCLDPQK